MSHGPGFDLYQEGLSLREPRWKETAIALGALVFSALGVWMLVDAPRWKNKLTGLGCLLWFGFVMVQRVHSLITKTPTVRVSPEGVSDLRWSHGTIPWTAVSRAWARTAWGDRVVFLDLHQPERYLEEIPRKRDRGDLQIPVNGLDHRPEKVVAYVNAYIAQAAATALESRKVR